MPTEHAMEINERIDRLEAKVDKGFADLNAKADNHDKRMDGFEKQMDRFEDRLDRMNTKIDVATESIRNDIKIVIERVDGLAREMQHTTESIRKEHEADRRLMYAILRDHSTRIRALEGRTDAE